MFADHIGVNVVRIQTEVTAKQRSKPRGIQSRSRSNHARGWHFEFGGELRRKMRHNVDGVGDNQQDRSGSMTQHGGDNLSEYRRIALEQLKPGFARFLRNTA